MAYQVAARLQGQLTALTLDSYYHAQSDRPLAERAKLNYDHPDALDWLLLRQHLCACKRRSDRRAGTVSISTPEPLKTRRVHSAPFVILEGILALHRAEIRDVLDLKVFVVTDPDECLRRRLERDIAERGRTRASVMEQYEATVWPMAIEYVLPSRSYADLIVSGEEPIDQGVDQVLRRIASLGQSHAATA